MTIVVMAMPALEGAPAACSAAEHLVTAGRELCIVARLACSFHMKRACTSALNSLRLGGAHRAGVRGGTGQRGPRQRESGGRARLRLRRPAHTAQAWPLAKAATIARAVAHALSSSSGSDEQYLRD